MKKLKTLAASLLLGLSSTFAFAEQTPPSESTVAVAPTTQAEQVAVVQSPTATNLNAVNINTASVAEIQDKMIGIGAKKAQAIVDYRTKNGAFVSIEQLTEVSGIGRATLEKNRDRLVLQ